MAMDRRLLLLAVALAAAATSCSVKAPSVAFSAICAPPDAGNCTFASTCDAQSIGPPTMDVAHTSQLWLTVEVHNQAVDNTDETIGRVNTQDAYLQEVDVSYSGALAIPASASRMQEMVPAGGTAVLSVFAIPTSAGLTGASVGAGSTVGVIAKVKGKGIFGDGTSFETPDFEVPVDVCNGCIGQPVCAAGTTLVVCPPSDRSPVEVGQSPQSAACQ
jgi:hypothetical protein